MKNYLHHINIDFDNATSDVAYFYLDADIVRRFWDSSQPAKNLMMHVAKMFTHQETGCNKAIYDTRITITGRTKPRWNCIDYLSSCNGLEMPFARKFIQGISFTEGNWKNPCLIVHGGKAYDDFMHVCEAIDRGFKASNDNSGILFYPSIVCVRDGTSNFIMDNFRSSFKESWMSKETPLQIEFAIASSPKPAIVCYDTEEFAEAISRIALKYGFGISML